MNIHDKPTREELEQLSLEELKQVKEAWRGLAGHFNKLFLEAANTCTTIACVEYEKEMEEG